MEKRKKKRMNSINKLSWNLSSFPSVSRRWVVPD